MGQVRDAVLMLEEKTWANTIEAKAKQVSRELDEHHGRQLRPLAGERRPQILDTLWVQTQQTDIGSHKVSFLAL